MENLLCVTLLGRFTLSAPGRRADALVTEQASSSRRMWALLEYLTFFHDRAVGQEELIEVLWGDAGVSNPVNTLKTLLHRARLLLESLGFPDGKQVLLYRRGLYSWGPGVTVRTDADRFDQLAADFENAPDSPAGLDAAIQALELYQGDFLPNAAGGPWAVSLRTYYHSKYLRLCADAAHVLQDMGRLEEAAALCRTATTLDPYDETCQLLLMRLLHASGSKQAAIRHYTRVRKLFMDRLGVGPSEQMSLFYHELTRSGENLELDLQVVRDGLVEDEPPAGPLFCEYAVFQNMYRLAARAAPRSGQIVQLAMITLTDGQGDPLPAGRCAAAMEELKTAIFSSLRACDVFCRSSPAQYLIMLPTASRENGAMALERALAAFERTVSGKLCASQFSLLPVLPLEQT